MDYFTCHVIWNQSPATICTQHWLHLLCINDMIDFFVFIPSHFYIVQNIESITVWNERYRTTSSLQLLIISSFGWKPSAEWQFRSKKLKMMTLHCSVAGTHYLLNTARSGHLSDMTHLLFSYYCMNDISIRDIVRIWCCIFLLLKVAELHHHPCFILKRLWMHCPKV